MKKFSYNTRSSRRGPLGMNTLFVPASAADIAQPDESVNAVPVVSERSLTCCNTSHTTLVHPPQQSQSSSQPSSLFEVKSKTGEKKIKLKKLERKEIIQTKQRRIIMVRLLELSSSIGCNKQKGGLR
jgi:hypothetical protein